MSEALQESEVKVVQTDIDSTDGQNKCPKCGSTEISLNTKSGKLRCNFCRHEFEPISGKTELDYDDITQLKGEIIGSGAANIEKETNNIVTFKCTSCGAEVVVDTSQSTQARCHWCRHTLSVNSTVPNGAVPDVVLPFKLNKADARTQIETFVGKRKFFAKPQFKREFSTENIMGVYLPYMVIDVNAHAEFYGQGEHEVRSYTVKEGDINVTYYDADLYEVGRDFDMILDDLTIESSLDKLNKKDSSKTNNIINSIMPFDTENCVKWDSNYLSGFTSEKRDANIEQLKPLVDKQIKDIARIGINSDLTKYDRGVRWDSERIDLIGRSWKTAYLPVWLYSYQEIKGSKSLLHYVAVNARTKETMGSVPIHIPKLLLVSAFVEVLSWFAKLFADTLVDSDLTWLLLISGFGFFGIMYSKYRNTGARHHFESETKKRIFNISRKDMFIKKRTGLSNSTMEGANNERIDG